MFIKAKKIKIGQERKNCNLLSSLDIYMAFEFNSHNLSPMFTVWHSLRNTEVLSEFTLTLKAFLNNKTMKKMENEWSVTFHLQNHNYP